MCDKPYFLQWNLFKIAIRGFVHRVLPHSQRALGDERARNPTGISSTKLIELCGREAYHDLVFHCNDLEETGRWLGLVR